MDLLHVNGDGTVPLFSATLEDTTRSLDHNSNAHVYYVSNVDHGELPVHDDVLQLVANILRGDPAVPESISQSQTGKCKGKVISVESPVELHVYDQTGNHTGRTSLPNIPEAQPIVEEGIPGSTYEELLESKFVYLPEEGRYLLWLKATGEGTFNLRIRSYDNDQVSGTILYLRVPLTQTTVGQVLYDTSVPEPPLLALDHDGDGIFEQSFIATSVLDANESADTQAPVIQISSPQEGQVVAGGTRIAWQASDDTSGLLSEWGILDDETPGAQWVANGEITALLPGVHTLTVLAEDRLGNAAAEERQFTVYPFEWSPPLNTDKPYTAQVRRTIPVKFRVSTLNGAVVRDESVEVRLLDAAGTTVAGPFRYAINPSQGVAILGDGQYHHNLRTTGLAPGTYILQVSFNSPQMGGLVNRIIVLRP